MAYCMSLIKYFRGVTTKLSLCNENNLSAQARYRLRQRKSQPILISFKTWLHTHLTKTPEQSKFGAGPETSDTFKLGGINQFFKRWSDSDR